MPYRSSGRGRRRAGGGRPRRPARPRRPGRWRELRPLAKTAYVSGVVLTVVVVAASLGVYAVYRHLGDNLSVVGVGGLSHRSVYGVQNILVLGSQTRQGQKGRFGIAPGSVPWTSNSDNLLLVHLDPTHTHAVILSIPRDTMVYQPACMARNRKIGIGMQPAYQSSQIEGALNLGGPTCAVKTVTDFTGVTFDHFVEFDFNSFRTMVDAIGGVEVCVPKGGYHDPYSHLNLSQGLHLLTYDKALAYVRTRHGVSAQGDAGGDLPRIMLQQAFISSIIQKVNRQGILSNSLELLKIADTATKALTVDPGLGSVTRLLGLAKTLVHLRASHVTLLTIPTVTDPADPNRLLPEEPQDDVLFNMVQTGQPWHGSLPTLPPAKVRVEVLNGTGIPHLASRTASALRRLGYHVMGTGNAAYTSTTTVNYSGTAQADSAYTLMTALKAAPAAQNLIAEPAPQTGKPGVIQLVIGADFAGVNPPPTPHPAAKGHHRKRHQSNRGSQNALGSVQSRNAGANICSGLPQPNPTPGAP